MAERTEDIGLSGLPVRVESASILTFVGVGSNRCLGVVENAVEHGALVEMQACDGSSFQRWVASADAAGYFQLENAGSGLCLDVAGNSMDAGARIQQWGCSGDDNQKWNLSDQGGSVFAVVAKSSGLSLDVARASRAAGASVIQWPFKGSDNQRWMLDGATLSEPAEVTGFASTLANGLATTSGGGAVTPTVVVTCSALKSALEEAVPRVVQIPAGVTLDCRTPARVQQACEIACGSNDPQPGKVYWRVPVGTQTCAELGGGVLVERARREVRVAINSNKTLVGAGAGATIRGVSFSISGKQNVVIRNLTIEDVNPDLVEAGDGVTVENSHHVWIDHNRFQRISDGYFDIKNAKAVTVSYNHIVGANPFACGSKHYYVSLVDASDVTFDHNFFDAPAGRNPKVTGASRVDLYSNAYAGVSYFCTNAGVGAELLVEANHFQDSRYPHWSEGGHVEASNNVYVGTSAGTSQKRDSNADVFAPPYARALDAASALPELLKGRVGPQEGVGP